MYLAALEYAMAGWHIFPVKGKVPATKNGFKDATTEIGQIEEWFQDKANIGIGVATGDISGIVVLDIDGAIGLKSLDELQKEHGELPRTATARTGGGGWHVYFEQPVNGMRCSTGLLGEGLDIRATGGYVVVPPSAHRSGTPYEWAGGREFRKIPLAQAPPWLNVQRTKARDRDPDWFATKGARNAELLSVGGTLRRMGLGYDEILPALLVVNEKRCKPPVLESEVRRISESLCRYTPGESQFGTYFQNTEMEPAA